MPAGGENYNAADLSMQLANDVESQKELLQTLPGDTSARYQLDCSDVVELLQSRSRAIPLYEAAQLFFYLDDSFDHDNGAIWGIPLHAPILFYDTVSRELVANRHDPDGMLEKLGGVYLGVLPDDLIFFDGVVTFSYFGGERWVMVPWLLMDGNDMAYNLRMLSHKAFHWHQPLFLGELKILDNSHMNEIEARISIRLEINALIIALSMEGDAGLAAIHDALAIRAERRRVFGMEAEENAFELLEGLAQYIEWGLELERVGNIMDMQLSELLRSWAESMVQGDNLERTYGYLSGALYAFLLNKADPSWMQTVHGDSDLGMMLKGAVGITTLLPIDEIALDRYGYTLISSQERTWVTTRERTMEQITESLENNPVLKFFFDYVEIEGATIQGQWFTFPDFGAVSRGAPQLIGSFGRLSVTNGDLILSEIEGAWMIVALDIEIGERRISGRTWLLELNDGYEVQRDGNDYVVKRIESITPDSSRRLVPRPSLIDYPSPTRAELPKNI